MGRKNEFGSERDRDADFDVKMLWWLAYGGLSRPSIYRQNWMRVRHWCDPKFPQPPFQIPPPLTPFNFFSYLFSMAIAFFCPLSQWCACIIKRLLTTARPIIIIFKDQSCSAMNNVFSWHFFWILTKVLLLKTDLKKKLTGPLNNLKLWKLN